MRHFFSLTTYNRSTYVLLASIIVGLVCSRALVSIATVLLVVNMLLHSNVLFRAVKKWYSGYKIYFLLLIPVSILFLLPFAPSFWLATELFYHKLPFLIIPLAVGFLSVFNKQVLYKFLYFFSVVICLAAFGVLLNYLFHLEEYTQALLQGIPIPAPHGHVRFSLMMVFAGMTSLYFLFSKKIILHRYDRFFFAFAALFLFVVVHVLSVRIGILAFYVALLFMLFYQTYTSGKYYFFIASLLVLLAIPVLSYKIIPSFKNRIDYMIYDLEQMKQGNIGYNSDSRRMISLKVGWEMAMDNLWLGVGAGNLEQAVEEYYQSKFPEVDTHNRKLPHNQFLSVFVELGLIGLLFLLAAIFFPLFYADTYKNSVFISLWLIVFVSMWVDSTLETQIGITFYTLFSSLLLKFEKLPDA